MGHARDGVLLWGCPVATDRYIGVGGDPSGRARTGKSIGITDFGREAWYTILNN